MQTLLIVLSSARVTVLAGRQLVWFGIGPGDGMDRRRTGPLEPSGPVEEWAGGQPRLENWAVGL